MSGKIGLLIGFLVGFLLTGAGALIGLHMAKTEFDERVTREKDAAYQKGMVEGTRTAASLIDESANKVLHDEIAALKKKIAELEKK